MLQVQNLHKSYGTAVILDGVSFILNDGEHVGLIGPNGSGKSTILRCITGRDQPDSGTIVISPRGTTIGYLAQAFEQLGELTVGEVLASSQTELVDADDVDEAMQTYADATARFDALGGYEREHRATAVLQGLQLAEVPFETLAATLSGGQKTRLGLAMLLLQESDFPCCPLEKNGHAPADNNDVPLDREMLPLIVCAETDETLAAVCWFLTGR